MFLIEQPCMKSSTLAEAHASAKGTAMASYLTATGCAVSLLTGVMPLTSTGSVLSEVDPAICATWLVNASPLLGGVVGTAVGTGVGIALESPEPQPTIPKPANASKPSIRR
jgi:hypothetical protein